jgi:hypothetical protein
MHLFLLLQEQFFCLLLIYHLHNQETKHIVLLLQEQLLYQLLTYHQLLEVKNNRFQFLKIFSFYPFIYL